MTMLSASHFGAHIRFSFGSVIPKEKLKIEPLNMIKNIKIHDGEHDFQLMENQRPFYAHLFFFLPFGD